ncbi:1-acyl-sn-glycerol-3-phosphate acyltransferase [Agromyces aurantiacus]|uniref:1-acyl-sn-glycerol-3-phosphate acyltransferase n=1 Tax=Agromyces aurantiacus TaxID=165814 RepID=A0ABV9R9R4_9MICO|nr:1-acyl-sn-glycerol-3-phosphate acyltransferase [Agromyces aurantiacus]MBM7504757.1 1-acyl-sn-glycerol-3-phosphate acyltransferase [Agromyces aurantiacus]
MRPPPKWVRRLVLAPLVVVAALVITALLPLWLVVATAVSIFIEPRLRTPRLLWMVNLYLLWDAAALVALFAVWIASGFGWRIHTPRFQRVHYRMVARMLQFLFWNAYWVLRLDIDVRVPAGFHDDDRPRVIASRHAGPGDSFILVHAVFHWFHRSPRIVLKDTLQWDPAVDVVLNRLPNRFIAPPPVSGRRRPSDHGLQERISELARGMGPHDALVIFPEGGNFTERRRSRAIERLHAAGLDAIADRAARLQNVMAPRPGGFFAALDAAPDADVFFVAHTGLDRIRTVADVWRELPTDKTIIMRFWNVARAEIPADPDERTDWLMREWERIDEWIEANRPEPDADTTPVARRRHRPAAARDGVTRS